MKSLQMPLLTDDPSGQVDEPSVAADRAKNMVFLHKFPGQAFGMFLEDLDIVWFKPGVLGLKLEHKHLRSLEYLANELKKVFVLSAINHEFRKLLTPLRQQIEALANFNEVMALNRQYILLRRLGLSTIAYKKRRKFVIDQVVVTNRPYLVKSSSFHAKRYLAWFPALFIVINSLFLSVALISKSVPEILNIEKHPTSMTLLPPIFTALSVIHSLYLASVFDENQYSASFLMSPYVKRLAAHFSAISTDVHPKKYVDDLLVAKASLERQFEAVVTPFHQSLSFVLSQSQRSADHAILTAKKPECFNPCRSGRRVQ